MPNSIKYSASAQTLSLKKGNFWIGTGDVDKGPTPTTGYYNGVSPTSGGYTIYLQRTGAPGELSYNSVANDSQLIAFTNGISGQSYTTAAQCLTYFATQTDKVCFNRDYESIITNGLYYALDPGFTPSYPTSGTTIYDIESSYNGSLVNGTAYSSANGGNLVYDGADDYILMPDAAGLNTSFTLSMFFKLDIASVGAQPIYGKGQDGIYGGWGLVSIVGSTTWNTSIVVAGVGDFNINSSITYTSNTWEMWTFVWNSSAGSFQTYQGTTLRGNNTSITPGSLRGNTAVFLGAQGIAANGGLPYQFCKGNLGTVLMYNRVLTAAEIQQNYNALKGRFGL